MQNTACYKPSGEWRVPTKHGHAALSTWRKVENRGNTVNKSSHKTPAVELDRHYGFLFKKNNNPNRIISPCSHLCSQSLQGGKGENTASVWFSTGKDTGTWPAFKKENFPRKKQQRVVSPRSVHRLPGRCQATVIKKPQDNDAFTSLSVKIWFQIEITNTSMHFLESSENIFF